MKAPALPRWLLPALWRIVRAGLGLAATIVLAGAVTLLIARQGAALSGDGDDQRPASLSSQPTSAALWSGPEDTRAARARALLSSFLGRSGEPREAARARLLAVAEQVWPEVFSALTSTSTSTDPLLELALALTSRLHLDSDPDFPPGPHTRAALATWFLRVRPHYTPSALTAAVHDHVTRDAPLDPRLAIATFTARRLFARAIITATSAAARARAISALARVGGPDFSTDPDAAPATSAASVASARDYLARQPSGDRRPGRASLDALTSSRLGRWLGQLLRFDLGRSQRDHRPVSQHLAAALPTTLLLILLALTLAYAAALPAGAFHAARPATLRARALAATTFVLAALPLFVLASLALRSLASARGLALFPPGGLTSAGSHGVARIASAAHHLILPALCLAAGAYALASTAQRTAIAAVLAADHTRTARAQGLPERRILMRALREAAPTMCALAAVQLPQLAAGAVIVERIFDLPGLGSLLLAAIDSHDEPVLLGAVLTTALLAALALGLADLARRRLDPRQRVAP